jgi:hypothetical protein
MALEAFMNEEKQGILQNWKWGKEFGAYERKIALILKA